MNKKFLTSLFTLLCILFLALIARALFPKKEALDQTNKTFVVKGDVRIKKAEEKEDWQKMQSSTVLEKGDVVQTAEGSSVDIIIGKDADKTVKIEEKSRVEFQGINPAYLNFREGKVVVALKKLERNSSFIVKTPTSVCGTRGTAWSEEASPERTKICVFENEVFVHELGADERPRIKKHTAIEGTQRTLLKDKPISEAQKIADEELENWRYWSKNIAFLREGKILINDFDRKENYNNVNGAFGSWNVFYYDSTQRCEDEITELEKVGDKGYGLKVTYDVDSPFSAYNGFFTKLMDIDISDYKYLVFHIKGDRKAGYTKRVNIELKNESQIGRVTVEDITDEWKRIVLPLSGFAGISDFRKMKEFVIVFNDIGVTKKEGVVYIDDIYFSKTEPTD